MPLFFSTAKVEHCLSMGIHGSERLDPKMSFRGSKMWSKRLKTPNSCGIALRTAWLFSLVHLLPVLSLSLLRSGTVIPHQCLSGAVAPGKCKQRGHPSSLVLCSGLFLIPPSPLKGLAFHTGQEGDEGEAWHPIWGLMKAREERRESKWLRDLSRWSVVMQPWSEEKQNCRKF